MKDTYRPHAINDFVGYTLNQAPHLKAEEKPYDGSAIAQEHREQASERVHKRDASMRISGSPKEAETIRRVLKQRKNK